MKDNINVNTKLTAALKEKVDHTKPLVEAIRKKHNEFVDYWLVCYSAESFKALDLFEPYLAYASLNFRLTCIIILMILSLTMSLRVSLISLKSSVMVLCS